MYDENLSILEDADYAADMFWLGEEEFDNSSSLGLDEEMDMVTLDQAATLIARMMDKFDNISKNTDGSIRTLRESADKAIDNIQKFLVAYNRLREMGN